MMATDSSRQPLPVHRVLQAAGRNLQESGVRNARVLLAVSGGGDSMALLEAAALLAPGLGLQLHVAHVDHATRAGSAAEQATVAEAARLRGASFDGMRIDPGDCSEDAMRRARHDALATMADRGDCRWILLGHSADDQVETILFRFLRGAGLGGLAGMRRVRGRLVRPLLDCRRAELRAFLDARGVAWMEDPDNLAPRYARTRLRVGVLPALEAAFGRGALDHLLDQAPRWRADEDYLEEQAARLLAYATRPGALPGVAALDAAALVEAHAALRARALRSWLRHGTGHTPSARELAALEHWLQGLGEGGVDVAGGRVRRDGGRLVLVARDSFVAARESPC